MDTTQQTSLWIRRFHPRVNPDARLVVLPHAGGSASFFFPASRILGPRHEILAVQYPGRQDRRHEPCVTSVAELADRIVVELEPWLDKPLYLFGHSLGASVAFEVALRLESDNRDVAALFASGRRAPSLRSASAMHLLDDESLIEEIARMNGSDARVLADKEMLSAIVPAIRGDYKAAETYFCEPDQTIAAPIHVHVGRTDPRVPLDEARLWQRHTRTHFAMTTYPGGHFYLTESLPRLVASIESVISAPATTE